MVKYNRDFLVPYLRDLCALYAAENALSEQYDAVYRKQRMIRSQCVMLPPAPNKQPVDYPENRGLFARLVRVLLVGLAVTALIFLLFLMLPLLFSGGLGEIIKNAYVCLFMVAIAAGLYILSLPFNLYVNHVDKQYDAAKRVRDEQFEEENKVYRQICSEIESQAESRAASEIAALEKQMSLLVNEGQKVRSLRQKAYNVNIIPNRYRDVYAVVYLYDYFSGSREADLAMALNTYVLEQIKDRLDRLIAQMSSVILNQYAIIDNQKAAMEQAERHHAELCNKLNHLQTTAEEHSVYLDMIEANTATMKYFATAEYIRELK